MDRRHRGARRRSRTTAPGRARGHDRAASGQTDPGTSEALGERSPFHGLTKPAEARSPVRLALAIFGLARVFAYRGTGSALAFAVPPLVTLAGIAVVTARHRRSHWRA